MMLNKASNKQEDNMKSFTTLTVSQNEFLENYLRGTGRTISAAQAEATFGIKNLRARMSEFRSEGLRVKTTKNTEGRTAYRVSARDLNGSRSYVFA
jgi:hypothetical protein